MPYLTLPVNERNRQCPSNECQDTTSNTHFTTRTINDQQTENADLYSRCPGNHTRQPAPTEQGIMAVFTPKTRHI
jgi:hypothetical protein